MGRGGGEGGISVDAIITLGLLVGGGYLLATGQLKTVIERLKEALDSIGGTVKERLPPIPTPGGGGGGGVISGGGGKGCTGTTKSFGAGSKETHGDKRVEWDIQNVPWTGIEVTAYITVKNPSQTDEVSFKLWGPKHSSDCCSWYIVGFGFDGKVRLRYEQPHPSTHDCGDIGSLGTSTVNKSIGYRVVIVPAAGGGAHIEAWADVGGGFKKVGQGDNPCGKKFSVHPQAQVNIRIDNAWDSTMQCGGIRQIGSAPTARAAKMVTILPHEINEVRNPDPKDCNGNPTYIQQNMWLT